MLTHYDVTVVSLQEYMRAKEEEWESVRERMHREIKILRRQNTESLSLKIDAGENQGKTINKLLLKYYFNNNDYYYTVSLCKAPCMRIRQLARTPYKGTCCSGRINIVKLSE